MAEAKSTPQEFNARIVGAGADQLLYTATLNKVSELKKLIITKEDAVDTLVILSDGPVAASRHILRIAFDTAIWGRERILKEEDLAGFKFGIQGNLVVQVVTNAVATDFEGAVEEN